MKKSWKDYAFVSIQFFLFGLYIFEFLPLYEFPVVLRYLGLLVALAGIGIMVSALLQLGKNFTPYPILELSCLFLVMDFGIIRYLNSL
jgi:hypothetical protein